MKTRRLGFVGLVGALALPAVLASSACAGTDKSSDPTGHTKQALSTSVVISQIYGAGGNSGATYTNDYIELFNMSGSPVDIGGWSVQYGSSANNFSQKADIPSGTIIQPGRYFLIQLAGGSTGSALPTPDFAPTGSSAFNMGGSSGKVALVNNTTALTCGTAASRCTSVAIVDLVGFGTGTSDYEGTGPAPAPSATNSIYRANDGCTDTDQNSADFSAAAAVARNSATTAKVCGAGTDAGVDGSVDSASDASLLPDGLPDTTLELPDVAAEAAFDAVPGPDDTGATDTDTDAGTAPTDSGTTADSGADDTGTAADSGADDTGTAADSGADDTGTTADSGAGDTGTTTTDAADTGTTTADAADTGAAADTATTEDTGTVEEDTGTTTEDTGSTTPADTGSVTEDTGTVAPAEGTSDDSGCGCRTPAKNASNDGIALAALAVGLAVAVRRKR